ncbi:MAG: disulfide bond formation protein DsbA [Maricaulis sp.]|nr:disulfide bond formation protein DsbA [Maricaulis sp.]|tara:strand:- start:38 stop:682 length:645 start_codon:yes stop_codon:yes gene_type:complete
MTHTAQLYWSFRSPYSYLALPRLIALEDEYDLKFEVHPVRPLALRQPDFFQREHPKWLHYLLTDVARLAEHLGVHFAAPNPDPVVFDHAKNQAADDQPHIDRLTRIGVLASEQGKGLAALYAISKRIWSGTAWTEAGVLEAALREAGLDPADILARADSEAERLDAAIRAHEDSLEDAGHWGVPTMVYKGEPFFGQDRIDLLIWRMEQDGLTKR